MGIAGGTRCSEGDELAVVPQLEAAMGAGGLVSTFIAGEK
jgi:hypothetical protein